MAFAESTPQQSIDQAKLKAVCEKYCINEDKYTSSWISVAQHTSTNTITGNNTGTVTALKVSSSLKICEGESPPKQDEISPKLVKPQLNLSTHCKIWGETAGFAYIIWGAIPLQIF